MTRRIHLQLLSLLTGLALTGVAFAFQDDEPKGETAIVAMDEYEEVRGMTISCQTWGIEWASDAMVESMKDLKALGVNWISIHPYAGIRKDGSVRAYRTNPNQPMRWLTRPIEEAHRLGMKIMIKPHLAHWGSGFSWRGDIEFQTDEEWERFFTQYEQWIGDLAKICHEADAFVIGTELDRTTSYEKEWRKIIATARKDFAGPMTFASNWDSYERVPFWDALDTIGIQAYFPLLDANDATDDPPDEKTLRVAWERHLSRLRAFQKRTGKRILFTEIGYNRSHLAPVRPWEPKQDGPEAETVQARCLAVALEMLKEEDAIAGAFLWKWFPGSHIYGNFAMAAPAMQRVIREHWNEPPAPVAEDVIISPEEKSPAPGN